MKMYDLGDGPMFTHIEREGISLRDWFAGTALSGFMANKNNPLLFDAKGDAEYCYQIADAMLEARDKEST